MGEKLPEAVYGEILAETRDAIKTVKEPMKSKSEEVQASPSTPSRSIATWRRTSQRP